MILFILLIIVMVVIIILGSLYDSYSQNKKVVDEEKEYKNWLTNIEPIHRNLNSYPEDWAMRREYVARRAIYSCEECGRQGERGFHVHHNIPLSKGGDNSLENLVYLCKYCHENIHPHMFYKSLKKYKSRYSTSKKSSKY